MSPLFVAVTVPTVFLVAWPILTVGTSCARAINGAASRVASRRMRAICFATDWAGMTRTFVKDER